MPFSFRLLSSLIFTYSLSTAVVADAQRPFRYIDGEGISPIVYKDKEGGVLGIVPESVYLIFDALELELEADLVPDARTLFELTNGRAEVSSAIIYADLQTSDFPQSLTICPVAMLDFPIYTVWHREGDFSEVKMQTLENVKMGMLNQPPGLEDAAGFSYDNVASFNSVDAMMKALISKRVDTIFMNWSHAQLIAERLGRKSEIIKGPYYGNIQIHLALLTRAFQPNILTQACDHVERFKKQGAFNRIFKAYLD